MPDTAASLDVSAIAIGLLGGLALFLFGMERMTDALKAAAGDGMRKVLQKLTTNRVTAALTGALVTAVIQSSSVTTVLVVGFVSAELMTLVQSVGVIMGANVGTTITAQIIAFKITQYALLLIALGFGAAFLSRREVVRHLGDMVFGLGLVFFGMDLMSGATEPLRGYAPFIELMQGLDRPLVAVAVSAAFTALVQSSSATTGIVIVLATQGFISLEAGIALALGSNVGTCATALLATLGKPRVALQAAAVHVVFNVAGVLLWLFFIDQLAGVVRAISPAHPELDALARLAAETPRQVANAHTVFNVANTLLFLPLAGLIAAGVQRLLPVPPAVVPEESRPRFLEEVFLETPDLAVERLRLETARMGETLNGGLGALSGEEGLPGQLDTERFRAAAASVGSVYAALLEYARRLQRGQLTERTSRELERVLLSASHLFSLADVVGQNVLTVVQEWRSRALRASPETRAAIAGLWNTVLGTVADAVAALRDLDRGRAQAVVDAKAEVGRQADWLLRRLGARLASDEPDRVVVYRLESEFVELLKRMHYFVKRVAKNVLSEVDDVELAATPA